jgi:hypothetical protein
MPTRHLKYAIPHLNALAGKTAQTLDLELPEDSSLGQHLAAKAADERHDEEQNKAEQAANKPKPTRRRFM